MGPGDFPAAPGPNALAEKPELFWGIVASMWIGNLMLVVLNLPLVGLWVRRGATRAPASSA